jgi:hypothetical protein
MTLGQFLERTAKTARSRRPVWLMRIPGGKKTFRVIRYLFH